MMRGSSELLQRSVRALVPVVEAISQEPTASWFIDVPADDEGIDAVVGLAERIRRAFTVKASDVLVTKTLLGVFGSIPAFDRYFMAGFKTSQFSRRTVARVGDYYERHRDVLDRISVRTLDLTTGKETDRYYPGGKIIDMIFFQEGLNNAGR
jgi:hypothetical protein